MKKITALFMALILTLNLCACTAAQPEDSEEETSQGPTWQEQYDLGVRYLSEGNYEEAIIAFTAAIEIDPKQAPAYVGRGDAYVLSGETASNLAAATTDYERAIELDEANAEAYLGLADVYIRLGDAEAGWRVLEQGLAVTGDVRLQERLDELDETERKKGRPEGASETVTAVGWFVDNGDEYHDQWSPHIKQYQIPTVHASVHTYASIPPCGIRFDAAVNTQFSSDALFIQEAEVNNLFMAYEELELLLGHRVEVTGYFLPREESGELTGPEYYEFDGKTEIHYTYHPNGDYYFYIESYTILD